MAEGFSADPQAMVDAVARMGEFQRYAEDMLAEIDTAVNNLHATWSGQGAAAHAEAHHHWARGEEMMRAALAQLQSAAKTAHGNYTGVMAKNLGMWS